MPVTGLVLVGLVASTAVALALFLSVAWGRPESPDRLLRAAFAVLAVGVAFLAVYLYLV